VRGSMRTTGDELPSAVGQVSNLPTAGRLETCPTPPSRSRLPGRGFRAAILALHLRTTPSHVVRAFKEVHAVVAWSPDRATTRGAVRRKGDYAK
jgi:hypothetical protein